MTSAGWPETIVCCGIFFITKDFLEEFIDSFKIAEHVFLTEIRCNREKQEDYPGITSHLITDKLENAEIISGEDMHKVAYGEDEVICFMGCAHIDDLIEAYKNANM